ncbi:replication initiation protein [uncultured Fusobacterium sp.]|uniref:replication initiation protein n=2 Tax=Fusobacterium TaxID=848 RepID=UPI0025E5A990|nr:replication initiation protein [uncultured Fusobacterium sp.]
MGRKRKEKLLDNIYSYNKTETENMLKQHTALTTYLPINDYYNIHVEKVLFSLQKYKQNIMYKDFYDIFRNYLNKILINEKENDNIINMIYKKDIEIDSDYFKTLSLNKKELKIFYNEIEEFNNSINHTVDSLSIEKQQQMVSLKIDKLFNKIVNEKESTNCTLFSEEDKTINENDILNIIYDIKEYSRKKVILKHLPAVSIDLTSLANSLNIKNITLLKKSISKATNIKLEFNYINKKNKSVELISNFISEVEFQQIGKSTILSFSIPQKILTLSLLPEVYAPLYAIEIERMSGKYVYRLYNLFKDFINFTNKITLTKEQLISFLQIPSTTAKNAADIKKRVLDPTIGELNEITNMECTYELTPKRGFKEIIFTVKYKSIEKEIKIIPVKEAKTKEKITYLNYEKILEKTKKAKRNIYVNKAWNGKVDNKINKILSEKGEEYTLNILEQLYLSLNSEVTTTLVQYINGMIKNIDVKLKQNIKDSIKETKNKKKTLFEVEEKDIEKTEMNIEEALKYYYSLSLKEQKALEEIFLEECSIETKAPINLLLQLKENSREFYNLTIGEYLLKALKKPKKRIEINNENWLDYYNKLDEYEKLKVEEEAIQLCIGEGLGTIEILLRMKEKNFELYIGTLKGYIIDILKRSM